MAIFFCCSGAVLFQIIHKEIPISKYRNVHTGPNTFEGGFHSGFTNESNQEPRPEFDRKALMIPVASQMRMAMASFKPDERAVDDFMHY